MFTILYYVASYVHYKSSEGYYLVNIVAEIKFTTVLRKVYKRNYLNYYPM